MKRASGWVLLVGVALLHADAGAGIVRGGVKLPESAYGRATPLTEVVVYVDPLPPAVQRGWGRQPGTTKITQERNCFAPRVVAVNAGSAVRFHNRDHVYHNAFSVSPAKRFDLGKYPPGAVNRVTFDEPGVVNLFCDIHPGEAAWVFALPHRFYARPNREGAFALPWLPPGTYQVRLWHPTLGQSTRKVEVPPRGDVAVALSF